MSKEMFLQQLRQKGYKVTSQRQVILDFIAQNKGEHLSPDEIYERIKKTNPEIGLATVYRTLALLCKMKFIHKLDFDDGCSRYELNRHEGDHRHHHLICTICGSVTEVEEDLLDSLEEQVMRKNGFIVKDHRVKLYGYCKECRKKQ